MVFFPIRGLVDHLVDTRTAGLRRTAVMIIGWTAFSLMKNRMTQSELYAYLTQSLRGGAIPQSFRPGVRLYAGRTGKESRPDNALTRCRAVCAL